MSLEQYLDDRSIYEPNTGCKLWLGGVTTKGYAKAWHKGKTAIGSRLALQNKLGRPLLAEEMALHKCDQPCCIEETHLFIGDHASNAADKVAKGRQDRGENHNMNKLTEAQVLAIRADTRGGPTIGKEYGITNQAVWYIRTRRNWRHV